MLFEDLLRSLRQELASRVRNGELTERGLARRVGISQAHMHNVLKGVRILTPEIADLLMSELNLSILSLLDPGAPPLRKNPGVETSARAQPAQSPPSRATSR